MRYVVLVCWGIYSICMVSCTDSGDSDKPDVKNSYESENPDIRKRNDELKKQLQIAEEQDLQKEEFSYETHPVEEGFGYSISSNGKKLIVQDHIPGIQGNQTFHSEEDAIKVAELMIGKLENNVMPPSVTVEELGQLRIEMN